MFGSDACPNLIAMCAYITKFMHVLSMSATSIQPIKRKRNVYDKVKKGLVNKELLHLNTNDDYNSHMGDMGITDQS